VHSVPDHADSDHPPAPSAAYIAAVLTELRLPATAPWFWIASDGIINTRLPTLRVWVAAQLDIPALNPHAPVRVRFNRPPTYRTASLKGWHGYRFELFGVRVPTRPPDAPWPFWQFTDRRLGACIVQLRWMQARYGSTSPLAAWRRWNPGDPIARVSVQGLEHDYTEDDLRHAVRAGELLTFTRLAPLRGRYSLVADPLEPWRAPAEAYLAWKQEYPRGTQEQYAPSHGLSVSTLKRYVRAYRKQVAKN